MVSGTARGVGKTLVAAALMRALRDVGVNAVAMKPVAIGHLRANGSWHSSEIQRLAAAGAFGLPQRALCARWVAEADAMPGGSAGGKPLVDAIVDTFQVLATWADTVVMEDSTDLRAAGNEPLDAVLAAAELQLPFVLVVGMGGDCVTLALASARALRACGLDCAGWIANRRDPSCGAFECLADAISEGLDRPRLGAIGHLEPDAIASAAKGIDVASTLSALAR